MELQTSHPISFSKDIAVLLLSKNIANDYRIQGHLGSGQFGSVEQGVWRNGLRDIEVAVKFLKEEASEIDKVKFLQEAAIMAQFTHPNVVSLYGVVSKTEPVSLNSVIKSGDNRIFKYYSVNVGGGIG